ncbi:hypothetical protein BUALT_Bualt08G0086900 [Buddleja alternifolia]|uniref:Uncharacterized protein n=1 Tax=Buddleja alternifolia TaxID=168488 RepID=A0AAV6XFS8_9LAMI|nr:hypothetical protein BUALT_Bualt08G0086900 [Buddleja alternifolia]
MVRKRDSLWWGMIRRKLFQSPCTSSSQHDQESSSSNIIVVHTNNGRFSEELNSTISTTTTTLDFVSREEIAAITIQACFRGHLGRRAFKALKSLVKLQAVVRGVVVRRQARIALHCMHALARLQITVRARQLLLDN